MNDLKVSTKNNSINHLIFLMFCFYFVVDIINGFFLLAGRGLPISIAFKAILFVLMSLACSYKPKEILPFLIMLGIGFFSIILNSRNYTINGSLATTFFKLGYNVILFFYINHFYNAELSDKLALIIKNNTVVFCINILLGLLGFGFNTYYGISGIKGFFYAGNEISLTLFCLYVYLYLAYKKSNIITLISILTGLLIGTKTAVVSILLFYIFSKAISKKFKLIYLIGILGCIFVIFVVFRDKILEISTIQYHLRKFNWIFQSNNGLLNALTSNRVVFLQSYINEMKQIGVINSFFLGIGILNEKIIESDPLDVFFNFGIFVLIFYLYFYVKIIWNRRKNKDLLLFNIIYLSISILAGHTWTNTTASIIFAIINTGVFTTLPSKIVIKYKKSNA